MVSMFLHGGSDIGDSDDLHVNGKTRPAPRITRSPVFLVVRENNFKDLSRNIPLDLLNDPIYIEAARVFAQNAMAGGGGSFESRLEWVFDRALNRRPDAQERSILRGLYERNLKRFTADPAGAREFLSEGEAPLPPDAAPVPLAAMTTITRAVLNLHELITRN